MVEFLAALSKDLENPDMVAFHIDTEQTSCPFCLSRTFSAVTSRQ